MAIIGKIREKSWLMLVLVGGALIAFIFTDYNKMTGNVESKYGIGTVYGEKVNEQDFNRDVEMAQLNADRQAQQQQQPSTPVDKAQVWKMFTDRLVLNAEYEALGIDVSDNEFDAYLYGEEGFDVLPEFKQSFIDSATGMFDKKLLQSRIEEMENSEEPEVQQQWKDSKQYYQDKIKQEKYFAIINQGIYVTTLEAKNEYIAQKEIKTISYVMQRYGAIKDDEIEVNDDVLKAYYEAHKNEPKYNNKVTSREVKFFDITVLPSGADSTKFDEEIAALKESFAATENDSLFVTNHKNSDFNFYSSTHQATYKPDSDEKAKQRGLSYPAAMDSVFTNAQIGDIIGPYQDKGVTRIAKVIDFNTNLLSVRHILIAAQRMDTVAVAKAKAKVDSLLPLINKDNFFEYVLNYSEDPGSKNTGGEYKDFMDYEMVPEFSNFAIEEPVGKIGYVQTDYGFHIIEVLDKKQVKYPVLAVVQKSLVPSQETIDEIDEEVDNVIYLLDEKMSPIEDGKEKVAMFDTIVKEKGYFARPIQIQENGPKVFGFNSSFAEDKILKLAFQPGAQVGDLIDSPIKENGRYIIAVLSSIKEKGVLSFENAKDLVKADYIQAEKVKILSDKMYGAKTLEEIKNKLERVNINKSEVTFANPQITGAGFEPYVVGTVFSGLKDGEMTKPIKGKAGVYVVLLEKTTPAPTAANYQAEKDQMLASARASVQVNLTKGLTKLADVVDNRRFYQLGIRR